LVKGSVDACEMHVRCMWQFIFKSGIHSFSMHVRIVNSTVIAFDSAVTCSGSLEGWIGGRFPFRGFETSVESNADPVKCQRDYNNIRGFEYRWRRDAGVYDLTDYASVAGEDSD
jgi:hypothetical protein